MTLYDLPEHKHYMDVRREMQAAGKFYLMMVGCTPEANPASPELLSVRLDEFFGVSRERLFLEMSCFERFIMRKQP